MDCFSSFLVNSQDRVIRVFDREMVLKCEDSIDPEPIQKLQDLVNRFADNPSYCPFFKISLLIAIANVVYVKIFNYLKHGICFQTHFRKRDQLLLDLLIIQCEALINQMLSTL